MKIRTTKRQRQFDIDRNIAMVELLIKVTNLNTLPKIADRAGLNDRVKKEVYGIIQRVKKYKAGLNTRPSVGFTTEQSDAIEIELRNLSSEILDGLDRIDSINI